MARGSRRRETRPVVEVPRSPFELAGEVVALAGIVVAVVVFLRAWPDLPERVPSHFGPRGEPDAWSSKETLAFPLLVAMGLYTLMTIVSRYPRSFNYPWRITEQNAARQYRLARSLMIWLKAEIVWMFAYIGWGMVRVAEGRAAGLGLLFLPVVLVAVAGTMVVYFWRTAQAR